MSKKEKPKFLRDEVASILLTDETLIDYIVCIVTASTNIKKEDIEDIKLFSPRINTNSNTKASNLDAIYENDKNVINIEVNMNESKLSNNKNMRYVYQLMLRQVKQGDKDIYKKVFQINLNAFDYFKKSEFIYHSYIMEEKYHIKRSEEIAIVDINLEKLGEISYNDIRKGDASSLEWLLYLFTCEDKKKREELYCNDEIMKKVNDKLNDLTDDFDSILFYDREEFKRQESEELGEKFGREEEKKEIAKLMLEDNEKLEKIIKYTGLTIEEIKKLQEKNK